MIKRKIVVTFLIAVMVLLPSCNTNKDATETAPSDDTVQAEYSELLDNGWQYRDGNYVFADINEECKYECLANIDSDNKTITIILHYDYLNSDYHIIEAYEEDDSIAVGLASTWMGNVVSLIDTDINTLKYEIYVGEKLVGSGKLSANKAQKIAAEYNQY